MKKRCLAIMLCMMISICMLAGCAGNTNNTIETTQEGTAADENASMENADESTQAAIEESVLEIGILDNPTNYYAVVIYETICALAGKDSTPISVELHDGQSFEKQKEQFETLTKHKADVILFDIAEQEREAEYAELIKDSKIPVIFFGNVVSAETLEETGAEYFGLDEKEETELKMALDAKLFDSLGFRTRAEEDGTVLYRKLINQFAK